MPNYRVQVVNNALAIPKDQFVNTLYFTHDTIPTDAVWSTFLDAVMTAFQTTAGLAHTNMKATAYNMADPTPRPIIATKTSSGASVAGAPAEVALCLSYYSGRNLPRTRGRIYFGPLTATYGGVETPVALLISGLISMGVNIDTAASTSGFVWCIHSVKDDDYLPITNLWVDNAWDTQRRRGATATARTTRVL